MMRSCHLNVSIVIFANKKVLFKKPWVMSKWILLSMWSCVQNTTCHQIPNILLHTYRYFVFHHRQSEVNKCCYDVMRIHVQRGLQYKLWSLHEYYVTNSSQLCSFRGQNSQSNRESLGIDIAKGHWQDHIVEAKLCLLHTTNYCAVT